MKSILVLTTALALTCTACGDDPQSSSTVVGDWFYSNSTETSGTGLKLAEDRTFAMIYLELTSTKSANTEGHKGSYLADDGQLTLWQDTSSCPGDTTDSKTFDYTLNPNDTLTLYNPGGAIILQRNTNPPAKQAAYRFGCFDSSTGEFTESPLVPLL